MGLPDRTGEPGDSEFGRPNIPSSIPNGSTPGRSEKYGTDRDFPFVDHVACFLCNASLNKAQEEGRKFWLTNCCHVLCSKHDHETGRCTSCGKTGISVNIIDKQMPVEMRAFIEKGDHLLERYEQATDSRTQIVRALKYQSDQLLRANKQLRDQLSTVTGKLSKSQKGIQLWKDEKSEWDKKEAEYQVQIVNLKNIIEVNNKELPTFPHSHMSSGGLGRIQEEGHHGTDMAANLLGKRSRNGSSPPRLSLPPSGRSSPPRPSFLPSGARLSLHSQGAGSNSSHGSARSVGPAHMAQIRTNLDSLKYRPGSTVPQTPASNGYHHGEIARPGSAMPYPTSMSMSMGGGAMTPYNTSQAPRPITIIDRLRQNGRTDRDDSPLRPSSAMQYQQSPGQSPMISRVGSPMGPPTVPYQSTPARQPFHTFPSHSNGNGNGGVIKPAQTRF